MFREPFLQSRLRDAFDRQTEELWLCATRVLLSMPEPHAVVMHGNNPSLPCKQQNVFLQGSWASGNCEEAKQLIPVTAQAWFVGWLHSVPAMLYPTTARTAHHFSHTEKGAVPLASLIWRESGRSQAAVRKWSAVCN